MKSVECDHKFHRNFMRKKVYTTLSVLHQDSLTTHSFRNRIAKLLAKGFRPKTSHSGMQLYSDFRLVFYHADPSFLTLEPFRIRETQINLLVEVVFDQNPEETRNCFLLPLFTHSSVKANYPLYRKRGKIYL